MNSEYSSENLAGQPVSFSDRIAVAGNASFLCLVVAAVYSFVVLTKFSFSANSVLILCAPLSATGALVLIAGLTPSLIPKTRMAWPLPITMPILWCLLCYLAIHLIASMVSDTRVIPEALVPAVAWSRLSTLGMIVWIQVLTLVFATKVSELGEKN